MHRKSTERHLITQAPTWSERLKRQVVSNNETLLCHEIDLDPATFTGPSKQATESHVNRYEDDGSDYAIFHQASYSTPWLEKTRQMNRMAEMISAKRHQHSRELTRRIDFRGEHVHSHGVD